jgi:hypothetical protein
MRRSSEVRHFSVTDPDREGVMTPTQMLLAAGVLSLLPTFASAEPLRWKRYEIAETRSGADVPIDVFTGEAGKPDSGVGAKWLTGDGRANLTIQSVANDADQTPAAFLAAMNPPHGIVYKRVTQDFFVVSSFRNGKIWYNRCNFGGRYVTCVLINYPASEKTQWDAIVTRISHSLSRG